jgi:subtilisin family serine protease
LSSTPTEELLVTFQASAAAYSIKSIGRMNARKAVHDLIKKHGGTEAEITDEFGIGEMSTYLVHGPQGLRSKLDALPDVAIVENDATMYASGDAVMTQAAPLSTAPTWGLERISQPDISTAPFTYRYPSSAGAGVTIYVIDTGILPYLPEFEGRARIGWSAFGTVASPANLANGSRKLLRGKPASKPAPKPGRGKPAPEPEPAPEPAPFGIDENGHGTHVAGTCAGVTYGVAKAASIVGVQVLNQGGSGSTSDVIAGIEWVVKQHSAIYGVAVDGSTAGGSVINLSLGGGFSATMNMAVASAVKAGIVVVVAAGNDNEDASQHSPASEPSVLTVGASTNTDARATFSNFGSLVDVMAPGVGVLSPYKDGVVASLSGTSMASPHVAGLAAVLMGSPDVMVDDKLAGLKSTTVQEYIVSSSRPMRDYLGFNMINNGCIPGCNVGCTRPVCAA